MKTTIEKGAPVVTLINVFTVDPSKQDELVKVLDNATEKVIKNLTGFVSANIHRSFDGRHVANYAQWESREALDAMLAHPEPSSICETPRRLRSLSRTSTRSRRCTTGK